LLHVKFPIDGCITRPYWFWAQNSVFELWRLIFAFLDPKSVFFLTSFKIPNHHTTRLLLEPKFRFWALGAYFRLSDPNSIFFLTSCKIPDRWMYWITTILILERKFRFWALRACKKHGQQIFFYDMVFRVMIGDAFEKNWWKKKFRRSAAVCRVLMAVQMKILSARFLKDGFMIETFPFGSLKDLVYLGLVFIFDLKKKFRRVATIWIFDSVFTSIVFCFWAWFDVKFYAELKKIYFMGSKVQSKAFRAQKRNLLVMKFL
jgi:hypothetical protein